MVLTAGLSARQHITAGRICIGTYDDLSRGLGLTVPELSHHIKDLAARWNIPAQGVADDAIFSQHGHAAGYRG